MRHGGDDGYGKDADRKIGGPRYMLFSVVSVRSVVNFFFVAGEEDGD
jgi:hypothetical protein